MQYRILKHSRREYNKGGIEEFYYIQYYRESFWFGSKWRDFCVAYSSFGGDYKERLDFKTLEDAKAYVENLKNPVPATAIMAVGTI